MLILYGFLAHVSLTQLMAGWLGGKGSHGKRPPLNWAKRHWPLESIGVGMECVYLISYFLYFFMYANIMRASCIRQPHTYMNMYIYTYIYIRTHTHSLWMMYGTLLLDMPMFFCWEMNGPLTFEANQNWCLVASVWGCGRRSNSMGCQYPRAR